MEITRDRIFIDKTRAKEIRDIKDAEYLTFDNQKDVFMTALSLGIDCYNGTELTNTKEAFFNDRDLNETDKAIIYALVMPELDALEKITDRDLVLSKAESIADKGFTIMMEEMQKTTSEVYIRKMLNKTDELYKEAIAHNLLNI